MKKTSKFWRFLCIGLVSAAVLTPLTLANEQINSSWYYGGENGGYALKSLDVNGDNSYPYTPSPEDWRDRNIYQLFTDRFATDGNNNLANYKPDWFYRNRCTRDGAVPRNFHQGGNWRGLRQQIGYLTNMGVTAVWISGVQLNEQAIRYGGQTEWRWTPYHQYHVDNFFSCDPASGTFQELTDLIHDLHAANIAVILDVAPNHMCDKMGRLGNYGNDDKYYSDWADGWWWDENNKHPAPFDNPDLFHRNGTIIHWDWSPENLIGQFKGTDDLAQENPDTSNLLDMAFKNLIDATDCDGFRVDAIKHIDYNWCRNWAQRMRDHAYWRGKKNFLVFGELFSFSHDALAGWCSDGYGFNSSLDFPLMSAMKEAFGSGFNLGELGNQMNLISSKYGKSANNVIAFLDNHDVDRFACTFGGNDKATAKRIMSPAMTFLYLAPPIPLLYYGTEHCFNQNRHGNGSDNNRGTDADSWYNPDDSDWQRECMFDPDATWGGNNGFQPGNAYGDMFSQANKDAGLYGHIAWLNGLRNQSRALRRGGFQQRASVGGQGLYAFTKWYDKEVALVLINTSDSPYSVGSYNNGWIEVGITGEAFKENGTGETIGTSNGDGYLDLSSVTINGKGTKVYICNFQDNSSDVYGGEGGGGSAATLWARNTYGWPTENATLADTIYVNTEAGNADNVTEVELFYKVNPPNPDPTPWTGKKMEINADWASEKGRWWHVEVPAEELEVGELQYWVCARHVENGVVKSEAFDNNGGGNYVLQLLPRPTDIGATFASVSASPTAPTTNDTVTITVAMSKTGNDISQLTVKMSYAFEGITGTVGTWKNVTLTKGSTYEDKTYFTATISDLPGGETLLYKLEASNGTADTLKANNGNAYRLKIAGTSSGTLGNCWHCPTNHEPPSINSAMRSPATPKVGSKVALWIGNYQGGDGTSEEHDPFDMTGGKVYYRFGEGETWSDWQSVDLGWSSRGGNNNYNNYWSNTNNGSITVSAGYAGKFLQYYFAVNYTNNAALASPTYLYMNPDNSGTSLTSNDEQTARGTPFEVGIAASKEGDEPGYIWHGGNITRVADNKVQIWAKIGYLGTNGVAWADEAVIRYRVDIRQEGTKRSAGVKAIKSAARSWKALPNQTNMTFQSTVADSSGKGQAMMWMGTIEDDLIADPNSVLIYEIYARNTQGTGFWRQAEYNIADGSCTFEYRMFSDGSGDLTIDGTPADYTTSKFFLDEADPDDEITIEVAYHAPDDADIVELFTNFGRRDFADVDEDGDGWPDGMIPPAGTNVTAAATYEVNKGYWQAIPMKKGTGAFVKTLSTKKCGVYRITARYGYVDKGVTNWVWYSQNPDPEGSPRRDHVVVISPKKAMQQTMYELNVLTTKATGDSNDKSGNFEDLSERLTATSADPYGEFSIDYLNRMGINCLWFQPIHPNLKYARGNTDPNGNQYWPGSLYATKNYFSVNYEMTKTKNDEGLTEAQKEANAVAAFTNFVRLCDKAQSDTPPSDGEKKLQTINVMLDGVMNHTSFDAVFGEGIELALASLSDKARAELTTSLGAGWDNVSKTNIIPSTKLGIQWYSHAVVSNAAGDILIMQDTPATRYVSVDDNDIANAPERFDFGKWNDVAELLYGNYSTMVRYDDRWDHWVDPGDGGDWYLKTELGPETSRIYSEEDQYYYGDMLPATKLLWKYMAAYPEYWIKKTGHGDANTWDENDDLGIDGLRCDYAQGLPNQFWEYCINRTRHLKWNFLFMAESLDGGKVGFRSNRQFDILNENMVFRFTQDHVSDPWQFQNELENRRDSYGNGLILLNETCHDEIMPWGDPQVTASRYGMVSAIDGVPMIFYGQEQAISTFDLGQGHEPDNGNQWVGFKHFEQNFGKWIPSFKTWNQMTVWTNPAYIASATNAHDTANASRDIAAFYGRINLARQKSPALQSRNRWFLNSDKDGNYIKKIMFCAKWEEAGANPNDKDAVFAAVLFVNDQMGENNVLNGHWGEGAWYDISPFAAKMGILNRADKFYNVVNLASTSTNWCWLDNEGNPKHISGKELYEKGVNILLKGTWEYDQASNTTNELPASVWTDNGYVVQFLKVYDVTDQVPPVAPDGLTINDPDDELQLAHGTASYDIVGMAGDDVVPDTVTWTNPLAKVGGTFAAATVWTQQVALATGTNVITFTAPTKANGSFTVLASEDGTGAVAGFANFASNCTGTAGMFVHDNVSATDITGFENNHAFGLYANTGGEAQYTRMFDTDSDVLSAGVTLGMRYDNDNSTDKGVQFIDAEGHAIFGLKHGDGQEIRYWYSGNDQGGIWSSGMGGATSAAFDIVLTKTANGYAVSGTKRDGGTFAGLTIETTAKVAGLKFWMHGVEDDPKYKDYRQLYFNNLTYTVEAEPGTATATATIVVAEEGATPSIVEIGPAADSELSYDAATGRLHVKVSCHSNGSTIAPDTRLPVYRAWKLVNRSWNWTHNAGDFVTIDANGEATLDYIMDSSANILLFSIGQPPNLD